MEDVNDVNYVKMRTIARVNYRSSCGVDPGSIEGVLEKGVTVNVVSDFTEFNHGHFWRRFKISRKHFYIMADYLEEIK